MRMKNQLWGAAGAVLAAALIAGCGSNAAPAPVMAHRVAAREPLADPRPFGAADTTERSYLNAVATGYDAGLAQLPLLDSPEQARQEINQAIANATKDQIPQLLAPGSLNGIGWVLTDALYMNAQWDTPFDPNETNPGPFITASGQRVTAQFMTGGEYRTVPAARWTAIRPPYSGGQPAKE